MAASWKALQRALPNLSEEQTSVYYTLVVTVHSGPPCDNVEQPTSVVLSSSSVRSQLRQVDNNEDLCQPWCFF